MYNKTVDISDLRLPNSVMMYDCFNVHRSSFIVSSASDNAVL